jgi:hypothetical protein
MTTKFDINEKVMITGTVKYISIIGSAINYSVSINDGGQQITTTQIESRLTKMIEPDKVALNLYKDILMEKLEQLRANYISEHGTGSKPTVEIDVIKDIIKGEEK